MATPLEKITQEVVELSRRERLTLIRLLLDLDQPSQGDEIEKAWDQEIRARVRSVDEGRGSGIPYDQIQQEMTSRWDVTAFGASH
jgi:putative addiction module component (TIGR02574 family)